jgi:hypothetical protein
VTVAGTRAALCLILWLAWPSAVLAAATTAELIARGHLRLESSASPAGNIVPGQKVRITLEVATDTWFTGGTRIAIPEVPGLVLLQTDQFAANASERRDGRSWVIQRWTLDAYPQRTGTFEIPPVSMSVSVDAGESGTVAGEVQAPPVTFEATLPAALTEAGTWVASPDFTAEQRLDREPGELQVGDAITREISFTATDVLPMMLPALAEETPAAGLAAYPDPPVLDSSSNRGQSRASRRQSVTYVAEQPGEYTLPAMEFFWWDTGREELQLVELPEQRIVVGGSAPRAATTPGDRRRLILAGIAVGLAGLIAWLASRLLPRLPWAALTERIAALRGRIAALWRPALPDRLNPGSSAEE